MKNEKREWLENKNVNKIEIRWLQRKKERKNIISRENYVKKNRNEENEK